MRALLRAGSSTALLLAMMVLASLVLWLGVPVGCLYIASQVQVATDSLGLALLAGAGGVAASIALIVWLLGWLSHLHVEAQAARGRESHGQVALEAVMAISAGIALVAFVIWFLFLSGSSPIPITNPE